MTRRNPAYAVVKAFWLASRKAQNPATCLSLSALEGGGFVGFANRLATNSGGPLADRRPIRAGLEEPMRDTQSSGGAPTQRSTSAVAAGLTTAPEAGAAPAAASTAAAGRTPPVLPSLYADVMEENLALVERIHLLDADYLRCLVSVLVLVFDLCPLH